MIRIEDAGSVRTITITRPTKRNALTVAMLDELRAAFTMPETIRAAVLLGEGPVFCSGFDLLEGAPDTALRSLRAQLSGLAAVLDVMRSSHAGIVAGVRGAAVAGGCALLGGCDLVVAHRGAKLGYPVARLGISPAVTGPYLRQSVGDGAARAMMLDQTLRLVEDSSVAGMITKIVEHAEDVAPTSQAEARRLAEKPGIAISATRHWLNTISPLGDWGVAARDVSLEALDTDTLKRLEREVWQQ